MRWLLRSLAFWAVSLPLFYLFGLPYMLDMLSEKASKDAYSQCIEHMRGPGLLGSAGSPLTPAMVETYCHCVSDGLTFTKPDLFDMVQKRPPAALTALANGKSQQCSATLQQSMDGGSTGIPPTVPPPTDDKTINL